MSPWKIPRREGPLLKCGNTARWAAPRRLLPWGQVGRVPGCCPTRRCCLLVAGLVGAGPPGHVAVKGLIRTDCPSGPGPGQLRLSPSQWPHSDPRLVSHTRTAARYSHSRPGATPSVHSEGCPIQEVGFQMAHTAHPGEWGLCRCGQGRGRQDCGGRGWTAARAYCVPCWAPE